MSAALIAAAAVSPSIGTEAGLSHRIIDAPIGAAGVAFVGWARECARVTLICVDAVVCAVAHCLAKFAFAVSTHDGVAVGAIC